MSEALLAQWRDRVLEAESEVSVVQDDINAVLQQRKALVKEIRKHDEVVQQEKEDLLKRLEEVEAQAKDLSDRCDATVTEKDRVEAVYVSTLDEYENMHFMVRDIKTQEEQMQQREDLEARLQRESLAWAEEEHTLRKKLNALQMQWKAARKQQQSELAELEAEAAAQERQLNHERAERSVEVKQQARQAVQGSRPTTPVTSAPFNSTRSGAFTTTTSLTNASGGDAQQSKVDSFVAANAKAAVPTRQNPLLKPCIKTSTTSAPATTSSSGSGASVNAGLSASSAMAAQTRAGSQPLVSASTNASVGAERSETSDGVPRPSLQALQQMRAYSYGPGKPQLRKRDILGESTNQQ